MQQNLSAVNNGKSTDPMNVRNDLSHVDFSTLELSDDAHRYNYLSSPKEDEHHDRKTTQPKKGIYSPNFKNKNSSTPVIFTPPIPINQEVSETDMQEHDIDHILDNNMEHSSMNDSKDDSLKTHSETEDNPIRRQERISSLIKEFSSMLEAPSPSLGKQSNNIEAPYPDTAHDEAALEAPSLQKRTSSISDNVSSIEDETDYYMEQELTSEELGSAHTGEKSSLLEEFTGMLTEPSTLQDQMSAPMDSDDDHQQKTDTLTGEHIPYEEDLPSVNEENPYHLDHDPFSTEAFSSPEMEESHSFATDSPSGYEEYAPFTYALNAENAFREEESRSSADEIPNLEEPPDQPEESQSLIDEFSSMLEDVSCSNDQTSDIGDSSFLDEENDSSSGRHSSQDEVLLLEDPESSSSTDEAPLQNQFEKELFINEEHEEEDEEHLQPSSMFEDHSHSEQTLFVKLPVLLASVNFDINLFDSFDLTCNAASVTKVDWSVQSLKTKAHLPSSTVFLKGVLVADIEYVSENSTNKFHTMKIPIDWDKVVEVDWITSPDIEEKSNKNYTFKPPNDQAHHTHDEYSQVFAERIEDHLRSIHFIWHNNLDSLVDTSKLLIQGRAQMCIDLLQQQYVNLNSYQLRQSTRLAVSED